MGLEAEMVSIGRLRIRGVQLDGGDVGARRQPF